MQFKNLLSNSRPLLQVIVLASIALLSACKEKCSTHSECGNMMGCHEGECVNTCESYLGCNGQEACFNGLCVPAPADCDNVARAMTSGDAGLPLCPPEVDATIDMSVSADMMTAGTPAGMATGGTPVDMMVTTPVDMMVTTPVDMMVTTPADMMTGTGSK